MINLQFSTGTAGLRIVARSAKVITCGLGRLQLLVCAVAFAAIEVVIDIRGNIADAERVQSLLWLVHGIAASTTASNAADSSADLGAADSADCSSCLHHVVVVIEGGDRGQLGILAGVVLTVGFLGCCTSIIFEPAICVVEGPRIPQVALSLML